MTATAPVIVPILGMHRSGTSFIARVLHAAGAGIGGNPMGPESSNLLGHWESWDTVRINDAILEKAGGVWDNPPSNLVEDAEISARISNFLSDLSTAPVSICKDPRLSVTFPLWKKHLQNYAVVACFRHPAEVALSLAAREGWEPERGLKLWVEYNRRMIENLEGETDVFWINYNWPLDKRRDAIRRLCDNVHLTYKDELTSLYNSRLNHHDSFGWTPGAEAESLYKELCRRSDFEPRGKNGKKRRNLTLSEELKTGLTELTEIAHGQNFVQQVLSARLRELHIFSSSLKDVISAIDPKIARALAHLVSLQESVSSLDGSVNARLEEINPKIARALAQIGEMAPEIGRMHQKQSGLNAEILTVRKEAQKADEVYRGQIEQLRIQNEALKHRLKDAEHRAREAHAFITSVRRSFPFRVRRRLVRSFQTKPKTTPAATRIRVRQIYYSFFQKFRLSEGFVPYYNPTTNKFLENQVLLDMHAKRDEHESDYYGVVSWRFSQKTGKNFRTVFRLVEQDGKKSDVYGFKHGDPWREHMFINIWTFTVSVLGHHPHRLIDIGQSIMDELGYDLDITTLKTPVIYSNYWIARPTIFGKYVDEMLAPAIRLMEKHPRIRRMCEEDSRYAALIAKEGRRGERRASSLSEKECLRLFGKPYYTYHPFVCERLFSTWLALNPSVSVKLC